MVWEGETGYLKQTRNLAKIIDTEEELPNVGQKPWQIWGKSCLHYKWISNRCVKQEKQSVHLKNPFQQEDHEKKNKK